MDPPRYVSLLIWSSAHLVMFRSRRFPPQSTDPLSHPSLVWFSSPRKILLRCSIRFPSAPWIDRFHSVHRQNAFILRPCRSPGGKGWMSTHHWWPSMDTHWDRRVVFATNRIMPILSLKFHCFVFTRNWSKICPKKIRAMPEPNPSQINQNDRRYGDVYASLRY